MLATMAILAAAFWIGLGLLILWSDVRARRRVGPLAIRPTAIHDLEDGTCAKLVGRVRLADEPVRAPLSGRPCAAFRVTTAFRKRLRWRAIDEERRQVGFYVDDGTGEIFVPGELPVTLLLGVDGRFRRGPRAPRALDAWLKARTAGAPGAPLRCDEATLAPGVRVAVYGRVRRRPSRTPRDEREYREREYEFVLEPASGGVHISDMRATLG